MGISTINGHVQVRKLLKITRGYLDGTALNGYPQFHGAFHQWGIPEMDSL